MGLFDCESEKQSCLFKYKLEKEDSCLHNVAYFVKKSKNFSIINREVNSQIRKAKSDFVLALAPEEQTENSGTGLSDNSQKLNLPRLHQLLAVFKKGKSSFIPTLVDTSGNPIESDAEKAEVLNSFFVRQASLSASDGVLLNILAAPVTDSQTLTELSVSLQGVQRALHGLDARKAPGFDGIPTRLLVVLPNEICTVCSSHLFPEPTYSNSTHRVEISDCSPDLQGTWQQAGCDKLPAHLATEHSVEMPRETKL